MPGAQAAGHWDWRVGRWSASGCTRHAAPLTSCSPCPGVCVRRQGRSHTFSLRHLGRGHSTQVRSRRPGPEAPLHPGLGAPPAGCPQLRRIVDWGTPRHGHWSGGTRSCCTVLVWLLSSLLAGESPGQLGVETGSEMSRGFKPLEQVLS